MKIEQINALNKKVSIARNNRPVCGDWICYACGVNDWIRNPVANYILRDDLLKHGYELTEMYHVSEHSGEGDYYSLDVERHILSTWDRIVSDTISYNIAEAWLKMFEQLGGKL